VHIDGLEFIHPEGDGSALLSLINQNAGRKAGFFM
jgi:hypothetical protein